MDIVRSLEEFVSLAVTFTDAEAVVVDWHGVLCDERKMREMYRQSPMRIFGRKIQADVDWGVVEESAYRDWLERFRRFSELGLSYPRVLAEADIAYYGGLFRGAGGFFEGPRAMDKWVTRRWETLTTANQDVSDPVRREAVRRLRRAGLRVFVASSGSVTHLTGTIAGSGFDSLIDGCFSAERVGYYKQDPRFWSAVFRDAGVCPCRALVLDDQERMLKAPEQMGARTFLLRQEVFGTGAG